MFNTCLLAPGLKAQSTDFAVHIDDLLGPDSSVDDHHNEFPDEDDMWDDDDLPPLEDVLSA